MVRAFLIKYAEIGIKGKNRYVFENALVRRVRERLDRCVGEFMVEKEQGRVYVEALSDDFDKEESGAVFLKEDSRKKVLNAWQERKKTVLVHPFLQEKTTLGLLIHIQALLLARHLRGDLDCYPPFIGK